MNRFFKFSALLAICFALVVGSVASAQNSVDSGTTIAASRDKRQVIQTERGIFTTRTSPVTLPMPADEDAFQFAIYGDRTGGDPSGLKFLRQAVADTNLMGPDFVMTVGDLIQGYNRPPEWLKEMEEFREIMGELNMQWFPVAGNHDIYWDFRDPKRPLEHHEANYEKHFGPLWYSFEHKKTGFIVLFSDEGDRETGAKSFREGRLQNVSPEQMEFLKSSLARLKQCRQVFVFLHHPRWLGGGYEGCNWPEVHQHLVDAGNVSAVFAGHIHHMTYAGAVDGIEYFTLATTGGHLSMENPELGYLHHFNVVTVRPDKFSVATVPVGAVIDPKQFDLQMLADVTTVRNMRPSRFGDRLSIQLDGTINQEYQLNIPNPGKHPIEVTLAPKTRNLWKALPDHQHVIIPPGKTENMKFYLYRDPTATTDGEDAPESPWEDFGIPGFTMTVDYLYTAARIRLPKVVVPIDAKLAGLPNNAFATDRGKSLGLRGEMSAPIRRTRNRILTDSLRINHRDLDLPQGPFTVEAWVYPSDLSESRAVVAKTQSSEFALFLHNGLPQFDVHLGGQYVSPRGDASLPLNQWTHLAGVYDGSQCRLYVNGKVVQSLPGSGERRTNQLPLYVGADPDNFGNPSREFAGQIDEVRLSHVARYKGNFEPSKRFQSDADTSLLLHFDQVVGPFVLDDSNQQTMVFRLGQANISDRKESVWPDDSKQ